jgi:hypothetical protein
MVCKPSPGPSRPLFVPEDGANNPVFARVDPHDTVHATLLFAAPLVDEELDAAEAAVLEWFASAEWGGALPELTHETLTPSCLHVAVTNVVAAREALTALLAALAEARVPLRRAIFARVRADGDSDALVRDLDPEARAQVRYEDAGDWWRACLDARLSPPLSEDREELTSDDNAILEVAQTTFVERRAMPLHLPAFRICYGLADAEFEDDSIDGAARARDVARVLHSALDARFRAHDESVARPVSYNRLRHNDAALDRIRVGDRVGYSCAFHTSHLREFLHDHLFRYREHELMLATRDAARTLDLAPVVCWRRFAGRYVLQLWERGTSRVHAAA